MVQTWAVVLAAGSGERFGGSKQYGLVGGARAVDRVVRRVRSIADGVVLVLPPGHTWDGEPVDVVTPGGATRSASVRAGLAGVPDSAEVLVLHDSAHPLAVPDLFDAVVSAVRDGADGAFPGLPVTEALKRTTGLLVSGNLPKDGLVLAQMPHAFRADVLRRVHSGEPDAVEDVELVCAAGGRVVVVPGDPRNLHITTPAELWMADALASSGGL